MVLDRRKGEATGFSGKRPPDETETKQLPPQHRESNGFLPVCKEGDDQVARRLTEMFRDAQAALCRFVAFGLYAFEVKEGLKHGEFGPWIKEHCPDIPWRTAQHYMAITKGLLYACGSLVEDYIQMRKRCAFAQGGELILKDPADLPELVRPLAAKMRSLIEGKTARQLFLEFKTADEHDGEPIVRRPGIGDKQWEKWMWEFHVELITDGIVPGRREVPSKLLTEFAKYQISGRVAKMLSPEEAAMIRREEVGLKIDALMRAMEELIGEDGNPPRLPLLDADRAQLAQLEGRRIKLGEAIKLANKGRRG
jgi:hypothetical protein